VTACIPVWLLVLAALINVGNLAALVVLLVKYK